MARYTAVRRTAALQIPVARLTFEADETTDFGGVAYTLGDASYYLGGPRGGVNEAPFVHVYGPDSRLVIVYDLRHLIPARDAERRAAAEAAEADFATSDAFADNMAFLASLGVLA